jgi:hypothetical protein
MRKLVTIVAVVAISAASAGTLATGAPPAAAQPSCQLPTNTTIYQSNGWNVWLHVENGYWRAEAYVPYSHPVQAMPARSIRFDSVTRDFVKFVITWDNGSGGVYTGSIDANGFVSGTTADRWDPNSTASWHMREPAACTG